jgi:lipoate-protein ligase B
VTWHGPGQAVLYPIVSVRALGTGARRYVATFGFPFQSQIRSATNA